MGKQKRTKRTRRVAAAPRTTRPRRPWIVAAVVAAAVVAGAVLAVEWMRPLFLPASQQRPNESQQAANRISPSETKLGEGARPVDGIRQTDPQRKGRTVVADSAKIPAVENHRSWAEVDDPTKDGWDTEAFSDQANQQLKYIGQLIAGTEGIDPDRIASLIAPDFACEALLPVELSTVFEDPALKVERGSPVPTDSERNARPRQLYREAKGFVQTLRAAASPFRVARDVHFKFKVFRVQLSPHDVSTRQSFSVWGRTDTGMVEQHATWGEALGIGTFPSISILPGRRRKLKSAAASNRAVAISAKVTRPCKPT